MEGLLYVRPKGSSEARFLSQSLCCRFLCCHHFTDEAAEVPSHLVPWSRYTSVCSRAGICTQASLTQGYLVFCFSS